MKDAGLSETAADQVFEDLGSSQKISGYVKKADLGEYADFPPEEQPYPGLDGQPTYAGVPMQQTFVDPHQYTGRADERGKGDRDELSPDNPSYHLDNAV